MQRRFSHWLDSPCLAAPTKPLRDKVAVAAVVKWNAAATIAAVVCLLACERRWRLVAAVKKPTAVAKLKKLLKRPAQVKQKIAAAQAADPFSAAMVAIAARVVSDAQAVSDARAACPVFAIVAAVKRLALLPAVASAD